MVVPGKAWFAIWSPKSRTIQRTSQIVLNEARALDGIIGTARLGFFSAWAARSMYTVSMHENIEIEKTKAKASGMPIRSGRVIKERANALAVGSWRKCMHTERAESITKNEEIRLSFQKIGENIFLAMT